VTNDKLAMGMYDYDAPPFLYSVCTINAGGEVIPSVDAHHARLEYSLLRFSEKFGSISHVLGQFFCSMSSYGIFKQTRYKILVTGTPICGNR
jgi:hypothetical protein